MSIKSSDLPPDVLRRAGVAPISQSKYRNRPTDYNGVRYRSKAEASYAEELDRMTKYGWITWWIGQPVFRLGVPENKYVADFLVVRRTDVYVVDTKGNETPKFRRDKKLWRAYGPCALHVVRNGKTVEIVTAP